MVILIPTGYVNVQATSRINRLLYFHCPYCDEDSFYLYKLQGSNRQSYHVLRSSAKKEAVRNKAADLALENMEIKDRAIYESVNVDHTCAQVMKKVVCPECGKVMPWSYRAKNGIRILGCLLSLLTAVIISSEFFHNPCAENIILLLPVLICAALSAQFLIGAVKTLQERKAALEGNLPKPVYFNADNIEELNEEKYQKLLRLKFSCPHCGAILNPNNPRCLNCSRGYEWADTDGIIAERSRSRIYLGAVCFCTAAVLAITGCWVGNQMAAHTVAELAETASGDIQPGTYYHGEIMIIDGYGTLTKTYENGSSKTMYALGFASMEDCLQMFNVETTDKDWAYQQVDDYVQDSSQMIGDCRIRGYFRAGDYSMGLQASEYRDRAMEKYASVVNAMQPEKGKTIMMECYSEDSEEAFHWELNGGNRGWRTAMLVFAALSAIGGAVLLVLGLKERR